MVSTNERHFETAPKRSTLHAELALIQPPPAVPDGRYNSQDVNGRALALLLRIILVRTSGVTQNRPMKVTSKPSNENSRKGR